MKRIKTQHPSQLAQQLTSIDVAELLMESAKNALLATAMELMKQDVERLCGKAFSRKLSEDRCHRGGSETTSLMVDGGKHSMKRPRVRKDGEEVPLPSLEKMRDLELLDQDMIRRVVRGVSTRNYEGVINGFADKTGIKKSSVSRAFKRASKKDLDIINGRNLSEYKFVGILIDGTGVGGSTQVVAVGITDKSQKIPLGLKEGTTENAAVVKDLLTSLVARGFAFASDRLLAVLDGGKALRAAVKALWGGRVLIQRCWLHKLRNIQDYIPDTNHSQLWARMKKMMGLNSYVAAKAEFDSLAKWLFTISHDAEKSLREAGLELLTVHELGITGQFRNSLSSTNIIESLIGIAKHKMRNVRNWNYHPKTSDKIPRDKALRWFAMAIESHRTKMRALRGGKEQMPRLINNLSLLDSKQNAA